MIETEYGKYITDFIVKLATACRRKFGRLSETLPAIRPLEAPSKDMHQPGACR
jgi:hypothetical protein